MLPCSGHRPGESVLQQPVVEARGRDEIPPVGEQRRTLADQLCALVGVNQRFGSVEVATGGRQSPELVLNRAAGDEYLAEHTAQSVLTGYPGSLVEQLERMSVFQGITLRPPQRAKREAQSFGIAALARLVDQTRRPWSKSLPGQ